VCAGHESPWAIKASQLREVAHEDDMTLAQFTAVVSQDSDKVRCEFILKPKKTHKKHSFGGWN
jgi:hypothetical protein